MMMIDPHQFNFKLVESTIYQIISLSSKRLTEISKEMPLSTFIDFDADDFTPLLV